MSREQAIKKGGGQAAKGIPRSFTVKFELARTSTVSVHVRALDESMARSTAALQCERVYGEWPTREIIEVKES